MVTITKTDVKEYLYCRYRLFYAKTHGTRPIDYVNSNYIDSLLYEGRDFETKVLENSDYEPINDKKELVGLKNGVYKNNELIHEKVYDYKDIKEMGGIKVYSDDVSIVGCPDLIEKDGSYIYPVEIKNHKKIEKSDRLELAFYYILLNDDYSNPKGYLILNTGKKEEVLLKKHTFNELHAIMEDIVLIMTHGTSPILTSECSQCSLKDYCHKDVIKHSGISLLTDIGYVRAKLWNKKGYYNLNDIVNASTDELIDIDKNMPHNGRLGESRLKGVIANAKAWIDNKPINIHGNHIPIGNKYVVIDCEYVPNDKDLYLIGYCAVDNGDITRIMQHFNDKGKFKNIAKMIKDTELDLYKYSNNGYDIVTYSGDCADVPIFMYHNDLIYDKHKDSLNEDYSNLDDYLSYGILETLSIDIYQWIYKNIRFPCVGLGLKPLSSYAGFKYKSGLDGAESLFIWMEYLDAIKKNRYADSMKNKLMKYNKEDLQATVKVIEFVRGL